MPKKRNEVKAKLKTKVSAHAKSKSVKKHGMGAKKSSRLKPAEKKPVIKKKTPKKPVVKKSAPKKPVLKKVAPKKPVIKKSTPQKPVGKKTVGKKTLTKKTTPKKPVLKKVAPKKSTPKKPVAKKPVLKKTAAAKQVTKKSATRKPVVKKTEPKKPVKKPSAIKKPVVKKSIKPATTKKSEVKTKPVKTEKKKKVVKTPTKPTKQEVQVTDNMRSLIDERSDCIKLFEEAVKLFQGNKLTEANKKFEKIIAQYPEQLDILHQTRSYQEKMKKQTSVSINKNDFYTHLYIADGYYNQSVYKKAIDYWKKAIKIDSNHAEPYYNIAGTQSLLGNKTEALKYLAEAIQRERKCLDYCLIDSDFNEIRSSEEFKALIEEARELISSLRKPKK